MRPVICICNNPYAPALRELKAVAKVHFPLASILIGVMLRVHPNTWTMDSGGGGSDHPTTRIVNFFAECSDFLKILIGFPRKISARKMPRECFCTCYFLLTKKSFLHWVFHPSPRPYLIYYPNLVDWSERSVRWLPRLPASSRTCPPNPRFPPFLQQGINVAFSDPLQLSFRANT